ncbi:AarF/UbiB family protein [Pendulispora brunnea]|uniref:AarF/UbiB family protein n=1 Tax=Pendulispora brunnea TaxID=2905690 RepID=A0ABZ2K8F6_9BACT
MIGVVSAIRDLGRLREISTVLVRHGFGEIVARAGFGGGKKRSREDAALSDGNGAGQVGQLGQGAQLAEGTAEEIPDAERLRGEEERTRISTAERARLVLQDLGPSFIKLGQIISTRGDILPEELITELKKLQDEVPPIPFSEIKTAIETSLSAPLETLFVSFDERPLATASIGQVHRAVLETTENGITRNVDVVVKVQRPGVAATVARDLELLHIMAAAIERAIPETRIYSPIGLVQQFDRSITNELNYMVEADNAERFAQNFASKPIARFPRVYKHVSSKTVLTLEFFDGRKVDKAVADGFDGPRIAKEALAVVIKMAFEDGFFHADPHPGNVIVMGTPEQPIIGLIDVGMVGRLSPELRDYTVDLMVAAYRKDSYGVADALYKIGRPTKKVDMREYRAEAAMLAEKYLGRPLREIEMSAMIRDLVQGAMKYGIEIPTDFMLVGKALMTIEGIGKQLDPDLDVFGSAGPHFIEILRLRYSPQKLGSELLRGVGQLSRTGYDMPMQVGEVLEDLRLGRLALRTLDPELPRATDRLGRRIFTGAILAALITSGTLLLSHGVHEVLAQAMLVVAGVVWLGHTVLDLWRGPKKL